MVLMAISKGQWLRLHNKKETAHMASMMLTIADQKDSKASSNILQKIPVTSKILEINFYGLSQEKKEHTHKRKLQHNKENGRWQWPRAITKPSYTCSDGHVWDTAMTHPAGFPCYFWCHVIYIFIFKKKKVDNHQCALINLPDTASVLYVSEHRRLNGQFGDGGGERVIFTRNAPGPKHW